MLSVLASFLSTEVYKIVEEAAKRAPNTATTVQGRTRFLVAQFHIHDLKFYAMVRMLHDAGSMPAHCNDRNFWEEGDRFDNPHADYR